MEIINQVVDFLMILIWLTPLIVAAGKLIAQKSHNQKLNNLLDRATIIVNALEQTTDSGRHKKRVAVEKLAAYASEVGINLTLDQADDYIEYAVNTMNKLREGTVMING